MTGKIGGKKSIGSFTLEREVNLDTLPSENINLEAVLTLEEVYNGKKIDFTMPVMFVNNDCRQEKCPMCHGMGTIDSQVDRYIDRNKVSKTYSSGSKSPILSTPCLSISTSSPCPMCKGN